MTTENPVSPANTQEPLAQSEQAQAPTPPAPDAIASAQPVNSLTIAQYARDHNCTIPEALQHYGIVPGSRRAGGYQKRAGEMLREMLALNPGKSSILVGNAPKSECASDVSIFIDDLREKARSDPSWARIYWDAIKDRQQEEEISPELHAQASQAVAQAMDVHVEGLPECCATAVRAFVRRILPRVKGN